jgi:hypothetical protein
VSAKPAALKTDAVGLTDDEFLRQFENCTFPYAHWNHRAHLRVAYIYLTRHGLAGAILKMTSGIRAYNKSQNVADTLTSGYHETMTVAWLHLVAAMISVYGSATGTDHHTDNASPVARLSPAEQFIEEQPQLREKRILRLYYTRERICSHEAKVNFVSPDLAPFPCAISAQN